MKEKGISDLCNDPSEVVREDLAQEAAIGFSQLQAGETSRTTSEEQFLRLARQPSESGFRGSGVEDLHPRA